MYRQNCIKCLLLFWINTIMWLIKKLVVNIVISAILLFVLNYYQIWIIIELNGNNESVIYTVGLFLVLWLIFWVFNSPIKWILKALSCPVNFLTLWLLSLVINVFVFYLFAYAANFFFDGELVVHLWEIWQTLILSFIMAIWISVLKKIF